MGVCREPGARADKGWDEALDAFATSLLQAQHDEGSAESERDTGSNDRRLGRAGGDDGQRQASRDGNQTGGEFDVSESGSMRRWCGHTGRIDRMRAVLEFRRQGTTKLAEPTVVKVWTV